MQRIARRAVARAARDDLGELVPEQDLLAERRGAALERERAIATFQPSPGAPTMFAASVRAPSKNVSENSASPVICADRADLDARLLHRHEQVGEALRPRLPSVGAAQRRSTSRPTAPRCPDLLPVDHPLAAGSALEPRARLHVREVGARVRLGVALAPDLLAARDRRQEARFCASLPNAISVGPSSSSPMWPSRAGAPARAYSSGKITCSASVAPRPPYSRGQPSTLQPARRAPLPRAPTLLGPRPCEPGRRADLRTAPRAPVEPLGGLPAESLLLRCESEPHGRPAGLAAMPLPDAELCTDPQSDRLMGAAPPPVGACEQQSARAARRARRAGSRSHVRA